MNYIALLIFSFVQLLSPTFSCPCLVVTLWSRRRDPWVKAYHDAFDCPSHLPLLRHLGSSWLEATTTGS